MSREEKEYIDKADWTDPIIAKEDTILGLYRE